MKKTLIALFFVSICTFECRSQTATIDGSEIGLDLAFSASTLGGNVGLGLKYGLNFGEYIILGPSARYEYLWSKAYNGNVQLSNYNRSVYGGGLFFHARFYNAFFLGAEFEMLKSPFAKGAVQTYVTPEGSWAPTLFLGGGISMEFKEVVRLNLGIMYDIINATNSPFRNSYTFQKKGPNGEPAGYLPMIYRVAFFFPLYRENQEFDESEIE